MTPSLDRLREHLSATVGRHAVDLIDLRLRGMTTRQIRRRGAFAAMGRWRVRCLLAAIRAEVARYGEQAGDPEALPAIEQVLRRKQRHTRPSGPSRPRVRSIS